MRLLRWGLFSEKKIKVLPTFLHSRQTHPNPQAGSADSDVAAQRGEDHQGGELQPGPGESHLMVEYDLHHVGGVRFSLDLQTLVLVFNTVLNITLYCIDIVFLIFHTFVHGLAAQKFSIFSTKILKFFVSFGFSGDPSQWCECWPTNSIGKQPNFFFILARLEFSSHNSTLLLAS